MRALRLARRHRQMNIHNAPHGEDGHHEREVVWTAVAVFVGLGDLVFVDRGEYFIHELMLGDATEEPGGVFEVYFADGEGFFVGGEVTIDHIVDFVGGTHWREGEHFGMHRWRFRASTRVCIYQIEMILSVNLLWVGRVSYDLGEDEDG